MLVPGKERSVVRGRVRKSKTNDQPQNAQHRKLRSRENTSAILQKLHTSVTLQKLMGGETGKMLVPGKWWENVEKEDEEKMYECVITNATYKTTHYEFDFVWVNEKDKTYIMLLPDVKRWMHVINPTLLN